MASVTYWSKEGGAATSSSSPVKIHLAIGAIFQNSRTLTQNGKKRWRVIRGVNFVLAHAVLDAKVELRNGNLKSVAPRLGLDTRDG